MKPAVVETLDGWSERGTQFLFLRNLKLLGDTDPTHTHTYIHINKHIHATNLSVSRDKRFKRRSGSMVI